MNQIGYFAGFPCEHSFFVKLYVITGLILLIGVILAVLVYIKSSKVLAGIVFLLTIAGVGLWLWEYTPGQCIHQVPVVKFLKDIRE